MREFLHHTSLFILLMIAGLIGAACVGGFEPTLAPPKSAVTYDVLLMKYTGDYISGNSAYLFAEEAMKTNPNIKRVVTYPGDSHVVILVSKQDLPKLRDLGRHHIVVFTNGIPYVEDSCE